MQKTKNAAKSKKFISIKFKVTFLVLLLSLVSLAGIGVLVFNSTIMQQISHDITGQYDDALTNNYFSKFDDFLNAIQTSSGISQNLGETFYMLKDALEREELAKIMEDEYHRAFARETNLLGGGAFYEPNAFYPDVRDFHYFVSKELTAAGIPSENNVRWVGGEWAWDVDTYQEGWYLAALPKGWNRATPREKRYYWSELYVDTSVDALMVSVCLPMYSPKKRIVGVATVDVSLSTLQKMVSSFPLPTPSTQIVGFSTINNATFAISGSDKFDIVPYPQESWLKGLEGIKPGQTVNRIIELDGEYYSLTAYAHESGIGLAVLIPDLEKYAKVDALQTNNFITVIAVILAMLVIVIIVLFAISKWIVKPIRRTFSMLETFAKGDLTQNITTSGRDELTKMMHMIDEAQKSIKQIIMDIGEKAHILYGNSKDLSSVAAQLANSANDTVAKSIEVTTTTEQMATNINTMVNDAKQASVNASEVAGITEQMASNINAMASGAKQASTNASEVAGAAEQMSANMNTIASAIEEMSTSIKLISNNTVEVNKIAADAKDKATDATSVMNKLGIAAKEIGQVTDVIKKIADKTNLLALNATIEAASAGKAGKGFAVVAGEIKELANQSAESADNIARRIKSIQSETNTAVGVIQNVSDIIVKINQSVETIAGHIDQQTNASNEIANNVSQANTSAKRVASAIGEVARGTNEIANNVAKANSRAKQVTDAITEVAKTATNVSGNASEAAKGADNVSNNTLSMNQAAKESAQGAGHVNQNSSDLAKIAEELKQTVAQFKV
ncbi:MAG: methyl-accepting chemotaxis protein [Fibromonadaceae bacterium]|nr:methyl-accepting chemotaxis protein [Fibromonadaceae bacterium]